MDDELLIRRAGQALLTMLGHKPTVAASGREAVELVETQEFDAVLLDFTMPVMSGKEAFIEIRQRRPQLAVAICTGYAIDVNTWTTNPTERPPKVLQKPYTVADLSEFLQAVGS